VIARIVTGVVLAILAVTAVLWAPKVVMTAVLVAAAGRCGVEVVRMSPVCRGRDHLVAGVLTAAIAAAPLFGWPVFALAIGLATALWLTSCMVDPGDFAHAAHRAALGALAFTYIGALVALQVATFQIGARDPAMPFDLGRAALLGTFAMVFMGDTGAYFSGKAIGGPKLYPLISPKKTVAGGLGGLVASMAGGAIFAAVLVPAVPWWQGVLVGMTCGLFGQIGDFAESLLKRAGGRKDSGNLLPGHGGLLDRVDGLLFAGTVVFAWLHWPG